MDKMMEDGGLNTDGMGVDPISGNEIPPGSNASEVRDDVEGNLSEGEYVFPADVVKYFGVSYFEKLRKKAKEGMKEMDEEGRIGGEDMEEDDYDMEGDDELAEENDREYYAQGGMVEGNTFEGADLDGLVNRLKAAAAKDPSVSNMMKAKGIFLQEPQPSNVMQQNTMQAGGVPPKALPPKMAGKDNATGYAEGGVVEDPFGTNDYSPSNYSSSFDPYAHTLGFSQPSGGAPMSTSKSRPVCPEGYTWDAKLNICKPDGTSETEQSDPASPKDRGEPGFGGPGAGSGKAPNPNAWMDKFDYADPEVLYKQTMTTLGTADSEQPGISTAEGQAGAGGGLLAGAGALLSNGLAGGIIGKFMSTTNAARSAANAIILRKMGREDLADKIDTQYSSYVEEKGLTNVPPSWRDGDQLADSVIATGRVNLDGKPVSASSTTPSTSTGKGLASRAAGGSSAPQREERDWSGTPSTAPTSSPRPQVAPDRPQGPTPGSQAETYANDTAQPGDRPASTPDESYEQTLSRGGGFAKGGFVKRPTKRKTKKKK